MFSASADVYDLIYSSFRDYPAETAQLAALIRAAHPAARRILDVACGTAEHARSHVASRPAWRKQACISSTVNTPSSCTSLDPAGPSGRGLYVARAAV